MSEGTTDQLFLALRLAAVEQSVASGIRLPFLADDLFVNFDDERSQAGFRVFAELARSTQVLFFTHHPILPRSPVRWSGRTFIRSAHWLETGAARTASAVQARLAGCQRIEPPSPPVRRGHA